ncbi:hypothetical protein D3C87_1876250 [compost metagenome]
MGRVGECGNAVAAYSLGQSEDQFKKAVGRARAFRERTTFLVVARDDLKLSV